MPFLVPDTKMDAKHFDLNDINHEPSDEQLASLMEAVADEARRSGELARKALLEELRAGLTKAGTHSRQSDAG